MLMRRWRSIYIMLDLWSDAHDFDTRSGCCQMVTKYLYRWVSADR